MSQVHIGLPLTPPDSPTSGTCDSPSKLPANLNKVTGFDELVTKDVSQSNNTMPFGTTKHSQPPQSDDQSSRAHKRQAHLWNTDFPPVRRRLNHTPYWCQQQARSEQDSEIVSTPTHSRQTSTTSSSAAGDLVSMADVATPPASSDEVMPTLQAPAKARVRNPSFANARRTTVPPIPRTIPEDLVRKPRERKLLRTERNHVHDGRNVRLNGGTLFDPVERPVEIFRTKSPKVARRRPKSLLPEDVQFVQPHIGEPCTTQCLDHKLNCGHTVFTAEPEFCATNCHIREIPDCAQPKDLDNKLVCFQCIVEHLQQRDDHRRSEFKRECDERAISDGKSEDWVKEKIGFMSDGWRSEDIDEMLLLSEGGKYCHASWIDPEYQDLVQMAVDARKQRSEHKSRRTSDTSLASTTTTFAQSTASTPRRESGILNQQAPLTPATTAGSRTPLRQSVQSFQSLFKGRQPVHTPAQEKSEDEAWSAERTPESSPSKSDAVTPSKRDSLPAAIKITPWWQKAKLSPTEERMFDEPEKKAD